MNLDIMQLDNLELLQYRNEVGKFGADVRKELTRREAIGFWKGGFAEVSVKQEDEVQGTVGQVKKYQDDYRCRDKQQSRC